MHRSASADGSKLTRRLDENEKNPRCWMKPKVTVTCPWTMVPQEGRLQRRRLTAILARWSWTLVRLQLVALGGTLNADYGFMHSPKGVTGPILLTISESPREIRREACGTMILLTTLVRRTMVDRTSVAPPMGPRVNMPSSLSEALVRPSVNIPLPL